MKSGLDCGTKAGYLRTDHLACRKEKTANDSHLTALHRNHEGNAESCLKQARELISANSGRDGKSQTRTPSLQESSLVENSEGLMKSQGYKQMGAETTEPSPRDRLNEDLIDALTQEMRTPTSSMFEGYVPEHEAREEFSTAGLGGSPGQILERTAQVRTKKSRRRASQMTHRHKTMPEGYYEAISQHVRRRPPAVPQKHRPSPGAPRNAESFDITNNESERSDKEESQSTILQDFRIGGDTELELMNASSAVQMIIRRMNKAVRRMTNDEY
ncbi:hypothetical protein MMC17_006788 [Xylographa soralifera]|nr:hypothetical protein [Xylographa soralifera]